MGELPGGLRTELDGLLRVAPFADTLGLRLVEWGNGAATVTTVPTEAAANIVGTVHGGVLYALADAAFEAACNSYGRVCVALDVSAHHASAAVLGEPLTAVATEVSRSARVASYRIEVTGAAGVLRAWYQATAYRTSRWHLGADRWPADWRDQH